MLFYSQKLTKIIGCVKVDAMIFARLIVLILVSLFLRTPECEAVWIWTPETGHWINPKYDVKETPSEQLEYALGFTKAKQYKEAIREFRKLIKHYPRAREAPEAQYYIGAAIEAHGNILEAFKEYQKVIDKYPFSERSTEIVKKQYAMGVRLLEGKADRSKFAETFLGGDDNIVEIFRTVIKNAPYGDLAAPSQYKIGMYLLEKQLYQEARDEFEKVINDYPNSEWAKAAQYQIALSDSQRSVGAQYDQKVTQAAVSEFKEFIKTNPDAQLSEKAKAQVQALRNKEAENNLVVAKFYEKTKNPQAAKIYYNIVVDDFSNTPSSAKALERLRGMSSKD